MAPTLESPMTQSLSTLGKRPQRLLPIIPAVPRSFEKTSKQEQKSRKNEKPATPPSATESSKSIPRVSVALSANEARDEERKDLETREILDVHREPLLEDLVPSKQTTQNPDQFLKAVTQCADGDRLSTRHPLDIGQCENEPEPSPNSRSKSPSLLPHTINDNGLEVASEVAQGQSESVGTGEESASQYVPGVYHHPLRATATSFHAHPTPHNDVEKSPCPSSQRDSSLAGSVSIPPQVMTNGNVTPSPTRSSYYSHHHGHQISFHPPPTISSNGPSSPAHSLYQGYAYNPGPLGYSPEAHSSVPQLQSYQPHVEAYVSAEREYSQQSPYYNSIPPFSTIGSQAPLTPSATPLDAMAEPWKLSNGFTDSALAHGIPADYQSRYRSDSHSTLRSDVPLPGDADQAGRRPQPLPRGMHESSHQWDDASANTAHDAHIHPHSHEVPLTEHLLHHFNDPDYADCELVLSHDKQRFAKTRWFLSSLLMVRSRKLQDLLLSSKHTKAVEGRWRVLHLSLTDRFITPTSIESALRVLYGMPASIFAATTSDYVSIQAGSESSADSMRAIIGFTASGCLLHLQSIVLQGLQSACESLKWENLEPALSFALEGGLERNGEASAAVVPAYTTLLARDSDPSSSGRVIFTPNSSNDLTSQHSENHSTPNSSPKSYHRPPPQSAFELLMFCLDFIVRNLPESWELDTSARPLADVDRLPVTAESRSPLSKSRLSRIQFGDHPSEAVAKSSNRNVLLSTILLSIPFAQLDYLLSSAGEPLTRSVEAIIKERERRRQIVLQSKSVSWNERVAARSQDWAEAGYEEWVEADGNGKMKLLRKYTGIARDPMDGGVAD